MVTRQTTAPDLEARKQLQLRNKHIASLIRPIPKCDYGVDIELRDLKGQLERYNSDYGLTLNPDFQRGHVWSREQQIAFIESWIRGAVGEQVRTITFNCPDFAGREKAADSDLDGMVCLDGLQRLSAVMDFMDGAFRVFTNPDVEELKNGLDHKYFNNTPYSMTTKLLRFQVYHIQKKADLLDYYLAFNGGGTAHNQEELNRIRRMREELTSQT